MQTPVSKQSNIKTKIVKLINEVTVEPIICFYAFSQTLSQIAIYNLTFQMACRVNLGLNETICDNLLSINNSAYEIAVQKETAKLLVWKRPLSTIIPAILILFMGSYSDRYKYRKPFFLLPLFGELIIAACFFICTAYKSLLPMEALAGSEVIITALTGGLTTAKIAVYSYIADISSEKSRTVRLGIVQILSSVMSPVASSLSGILFQTTGFYGVFTLRTFIFVIAIFYGVFVVKENRKNAKERTRPHCVEFFDPQHVSDTFNVLLKKKEKKGNTRLKILLMMVAFIIVKGIGAGEMDMLFLYTRVKFQWNEVTFGLYNTYDIIIRLIGSVLAISVFSHWLKLDDLLIAPITFISKIIGSLVFAFSPTANILYVGSLISLLYDYQTVPIRSLASKLVSEDELGRVQSLFGICEALAPSIFGPLYSSVYRATVDYLPGAFYLASAGSLIPLLPAFLICYFIKRRERKIHTQDEAKRIDFFRYKLPIHEYL